MTVKPEPDTERFEHPYDDVIADGKVVRGPSMFTDEELEAIRRGQADGRRS